MFLVCATAIIIVVIVMVVCVRNKNCPLYKQRRRQQHPIRVGVITVVQDNTSAINETFNAGNTSTGLGEGIACVVNEQLSI